MSESYNFLHTLDSDIQTAVATSLTELLTILVGYETKEGPQTSCTTYQTTNAGKVSKVSKDNGIFVYRQASLFKLCIAVAMVLVVDKLSEDFEAEEADKGSKYSLLRKSWDKSFSEVFNTVSEEELQIGCLPGDPSLKQLLTHFNAFPDINKEVFAPDESFLLSKNDFIKKSIPRHIKNPHWQHHHKPRAQYSNGNFILIAILIENVSGMPLSTFLKTKVFGPLKMYNTYVTDEDFRNLSNPAYCKLHRVSIAQPHVVRSDCTRHAIEIIHPKDIIELAILGGYTTAEDMELFFREVIARKFPQSLYQGTGLPQRDQPGGFTLIGLLARLDSTLTGSLSLNRLKSPDGKFSQLTLGRPKDGQDLMAYQHAGSATGTSNMAYLLLKEEVTVIALSNTTGILDATDLISRLCLRKVFDLPDSGIRKPSEWLDYLLPFAKALDDEDSAPDTKTVDCREVLGTYNNEQSGQILTVFDSDETGVLQAKLRSSTKSSQPMRFARIKKGRKDRVFRMCSLPQERAPAGVIYAGIGVDRYAAWKNAEFEFYENGTHAWFLSKGDVYLDKFVRAK